MNLQLKRSSQPVFAPNWHPNFRNTELLPDLKVVRTAFFVNAGCIAVAAAFALFTGFREYQAFSIRSSIASAKQRIESVKVENDQYLALNREFMENVNKFQEARTFVDSRFSVVRLLTALAVTLPTNMDFTAVTFEKEQLSLRGTIRGASEAASERATAYLEVLKSDEFIGATFTDISLTNLLRDQASQGMSFEIMMKLPAATDGRKPAGRK